MEATELVVWATSFRMKALTEMLRDTKVFVVETYWMLSHQCPKKGKKE